ncbi:MAG: zinc-binding dehydrogenase [Actinobacteria bacterium]|nr:zinc-binding dehydrogenase [Actinomycetota bacterium]
MRALVIGDAGRLAVTERPRPEPGPDDVVVRVHGAGLNRADLAQRAGFYPAPPGAPPDIPGLEFSGVVEAAGAAVDHPAVGDLVFGVVGGGAQAELLRVRAAHCVAVPRGLDPVVAGGVPEAFITAHDAMCTQARMRAVETVLVHAVGSGVGTAVVQLASALDATTVGTSRQQWKLDAAAGIGLHHGVLAPSPLDPLALATEIQERAGDCDVTIDLAGGPYVEVDLYAAALKARIVLVGTLAGGTVQFPIFAAMSKRATVIGTMLRARDDEEKAAATRAFADDVGPLLASGAVKPVVAEVVPLAEAERAYDLVASDTTFGKVILDCR